MAYLKLCPLLLDGIQSLQDAGELVRMFDDKYDDHQTSFMDEFCRRFLNLAIEHNHQDLVSLLLADARFQLNTKLHVFTPTPLLMAVRSKNITLIKRILDAGALVYHECNNLEYISCCTKWNIPGHLHSLIDYAIHLDETAEILQILVASGCKQDTKAYVAEQRAQDLSNKYNYGLFTDVRPARPVNFSPLHIIIQYAFQRYGNNESFALSHIIQLAVNAGASLHQISGSTPFGFLLHMIVSFAFVVRGRQDEKIATAISKARTAITETVKLFLEIGAPISNAPKPSLIDKIDKSADEILYNIWFNLSRRTIHPQQLNLLVIIFEQFITYSCDPAWKTSVCRFGTLHRVLLYINSLNIQPSDVIMDYLANMLRCSLSYGGKIFERRDNMKILKENFCCLAQFSSIPGKSTKLMMLILNELSRSQLVLLQSELLHKADLCLHPTKEINALEWIQKELGMSSLQHLARRAIRHAMKSKSRKDFRTLGLPPSMVDYVAYC